MKKLILAAVLSQFAVAANIEQTIQFDGVSAEKVYQVFTDSAEHSKAMGMPVTISPVPGSEYTAFGGKLQGKTIASEPSRLLVLQWRTYKFDTADLNTTLVLTFVNNESGSQIEMVHVNVPDRLRSEVNTHWNTYYWAAFKHYLVK